MYCMCIFFNIYNIYIFICIYVLHFCARSSGIIYICIYIYSFLTHALYTLILLMPRAPRAKQLWLQIAERFEQFISPEESDIRLVIDHMKLQLQLLGKSLDVLQVVGSKDCASIRLSNVTSNATKHLLLVRVYAM